MVEHLPPYGVQVQPVLDYLLSDQSVQKVLHLSPGDWRKVCSVELDSDGAARGGRQGGRS